MLPRPYVLPPATAAFELATLRAPLQVPPLKISDPAARAMTDFYRDAPPSVTEDAALEQVHDQMFRQGVRAFLVVRGHTVVGLITLEHARAPGDARHAADVMTPAADVPAVDWQALQQARVRDLVDMFAGSSVPHLLVLQGEPSSNASVRGLINRDRLERQLGSRWAMRAAGGALAAQYTQRADGAGI